MKLGFKRFVKRGQKGVTLVELMVVMAILAVLASIIFPAVSGTQEVSVNSQSKQDASTVSNGMTDYFADQTGAGIISSSSDGIAATTQANSTNQTISSRWPENFITAEYDDVFTSANVTTIAIKDKDGNLISGTVANFVSNRTAIDFDKEGTRGAFVPLYVPAEPKSAGDLSGNFNNYLWLALKTTAAGGVTGASRQLEVYRLSGVVQTDSGDSAAYVLNYEQIY